MAQDLVGKYLCRRLENNKKIEGQIAEVEAYLGPEDQASHARFGKKKGGKWIPSQRSSLMFGPAVMAYVYLIYGIHHCFNVVAHPKGEVGAILIRALLPSAPLEKKSCQGPGRLCTTFEITLQNNGYDITHPDSGIWVEERGQQILSADIKCTPRMGVDDAKEDAMRLYRYVIAEPCFLLKTS